MKKIKTLIAAAVLLTAFAACDKVPINGPLDGQWQMMRIETPDSVRDAKPLHAYLCFQLHLSEWNSEGHRYYAEFSHDGDSLLFWHFAHHSLHRTQADNNEWMTAAELAGGTDDNPDGLLDRWGIHSLDARFRVLTLNSSTLVLERNDTVLHLRKF